MVNGWFREQCLKTNASSVLTAIHKHPFYDRPE